jgi:hypothetical protein
MMEAASSSETSVSIYHRLGRAMAQAVARRTLTAEAWGRAPISLPAIYSQSGTGTGFSKSFSVSRQYHSTEAPWDKK